MTSSIRTEPCYDKDTMSKKTTPPQFLEWLDKQLSDFNMADSEAGEKAGLSHSAIYECRVGIAPGIKKVRALARLFHADETYVMRLAGLLPPAPAVVDEEREAVALIRALSPFYRTVAIAMLKAIAETQRAAPIAPAAPTRVSTAQSAAYEDSDYQVRQIWESLLRLPPEDAKLVEQMIERIGGQSPAEGTDCYDSEYREEAVQQREYQLSER